MKTFALFTIIQFVTIASFAQNCYRTGTFIGAGDVDVKGSVTMEVQGNGEIHLTLSSDFVSDAGPDLDIYLGINNRVDAYSVKVEALNSLTGTQTYVIGSGISLNDFEYITIHCTQYNHYYGAAQLGAATGNCTSLRIEQVVPEGIELSATKSNVHFSLDKSYESLNLSIYDLQGKELGKQSFQQLSAGKHQVAVELKKVVVLVLASKDWTLSKKISL